MVYLVPFAFALLGYLMLSPIISMARDTWKLIAMTETQSQAEENLFTGKVFYEGDTIASSTIQFPRFGNQYGVLSIEGTNVDAPLYFGDDDAYLRKGLGQYAGSSFPGMGSTILIGGHNNTYFRDLKSAKVGAKITVDTNYGTYVYEIERMEVLRHNDKSAFDLASETENIVLYTCYPFNMLGLTPQRYFVYGKLVSGPRILLDQ